MPARSPYDEIDGIIYFPRLCDKARQFAAGTLSADLHDNLGHGMDLWTCQFFGVGYDSLKEVIVAGASDAEALAWARAHGTPRTELEHTWWDAYMRKRGFKDDLAERLIQRKGEAGFGNRPEIQTFMDFIDADEGRL